MAPTSRPFIHLNIALDEHGRVTATPENKGSISCRADWQRVHRLREQYDAVAVGGRTWLLDSPRLNVRPEQLGRAPLRQPARVIFAGGHRCEVRAEERPTFIIGRIAPEDEQLIFLRVGGRQLSEPLAWLHGRGIHSMLVEGGPTLLHSFCSEKFADRLTVYVRTRCVDDALAVAGKLFAGLPLQMAAQSVGKGILLTSETHACAPESLSLQTESALRALALDYKIST
jgi:riboflavin biosynthesis pyrimidine reductase